MNAQQITILVLVVGLLIAGTISLFVGGGPGGGEEAPAAGLRAASRDPAEWSLAALPAIPEPTRIYTTEKGVRVLVLTEGEGEAAGLGRPIDVRYTGYLLDGTPFEDGALTGLTVGDLERYIEGLQDGLLGIRPYERRRILVPNELAYGRRATSSVPAGADVVFDVRWIFFKKTELKIGTGAVARVGSDVTVRYRGTLEDGTVFDSTDGGDAVTFTLDRGLIRGWTLGLDGMRVGGERKLWVPAHLAYGEGRGPGGRLPPWSNLIFVIELLDVK